MTRAPHSIFDEMQSVIRTCCDAMFGAGAARGSVHDSDAVPGPAPSGRRRSAELLSFIDFVGARISGTILLCQEPLAVIGTHPRGAGHLSEADVLDWANERVNQLAGRVANRLNPRAISIQIGLPTTVHGSGAARAYDRATFTRVYGAGSVEVHLRAGVHDSSSEAGETPVSHYVSEGAILLF